MKVSGLLILIAIGAAACGDVYVDHHQCEHGDLIISQQAVVDCAERQDQGYVRGEPFDINVVTVDEKPVELETANAYWVMQQAASADGVEIRIVSGFRTYAEQEYLYNCYLNQNCNNGNLAARPGYSNHQSGHALDLNTSTSGVLAWLNANGESFGFKRTVPSEDWHWEWWGGGPGGGICGVENQGCEEPISPEGGVVDDSDACFKPYGPPTYWRTQEGSGVNGSMRWTNAFRSPTPSNWARWYLNIAEAGRYRVEFSRDDTYSLYDSAQYQIRHAGKEDDVYVDQSAGDGEWDELGEFEFAAGQDQWVSLFDNSPVELPADVHIGADAIRLTRVLDAEPEPEPEVELPTMNSTNMDDPMLEIEDEDDPELSVVTSGCSTTHTDAPWWLVLVALVGLVRRR